MDKRADRTVEENPRLLRPLQAGALALASLVLSFLLLLASFTTDFVSLGSRVALLLMPVALGGAPLAVIAAFLRRRTWFARPGLRVVLGVYVCALLGFGAFLNDRGFGISGPPVPMAPPLPSASG